MGLNTGVSLALSFVIISLAGDVFATVAKTAGDQAIETTMQVVQLGPSYTSDFDKCLTLAYRKGIIVGERAGHMPGTGPTAWKQFMDACLSGKVH